MIVSVERMVVSGVVVAPVRISGNLRGSRGLHRPADDLGVSLPLADPAVPVGQNMVRGVETKPARACGGGAAKRTSRSGPQ